MRLEVKKHKYPGRLVYAEGGEFAGKSTLVQAVEQQLKKAGYEARLTKEPTTDSLFGRTVRSIYQLVRPRESVAACLKSSQIVQVQDGLTRAGRSYVDDFVHLGNGLLQKTKLSREDIQNNPTAHMFLQLGMILDRLYHHQEVLIPALQEGKIVISDRCSWSTIAYAQANGIDSHYLMRAHNAILADYFLEPDLLLFLDISLETAMARKGKRGTDELYEREQQMRTNIEIYRRLHKDELFPNIVRIDANQDEEGVLCDALIAVSTVLPPKVKV